jgi:hypothetical protein
MLGLGPLFPIFLERLLILIELALLGDEGIQHRQPFLIFGVFVVISGVNCITYLYSVLKVWTGW